MKENEPTFVNDEIQRYLLGEMLATEETQFEERYFADEVLFQEVKRAREELTDRYVRRQLSPDVSTQFEKSWLATPEQRERLAFAQTLREVLAEPEPRTAALPFFLRPLRVPVWSLAAAALCGVMLIGSGWGLWREQQRLHTEIATLRHDISASQARENALQQELAALRLPVAPTPTPMPKQAIISENYLALSLRPINSERSGKTEEITKTLPANTNQLKLTLSLDFAPLAQSVSATLQSAEHPIRLTRRQLPFRCSDGNCYAVFAIKTTALKPGTYHVVLKAVDESDRQPTTVEYQFQLIAPR